jgi:hypothetical protein
MSLAFASGASLRHVKTASLNLGSATPEAVADNEAFWSTVLEAFEQEPGQTNLVTVVRGVTTRSVREIVTSETARLNAYRPEAPQQSG